MLVLGVVFWVVVGVLQEMLVVVVVMEEGLVAVMSA